ncbi:peptidylprolyl isomerase [bacterium]|nr:peptidylprolyl isomerase [bacterium]
MKHTSLMIILICLVAFPLMATCGCETAVDDTQENGEIEQTVITDPDGVVLTINGMPVTKAELEDVVESATPDNKMGLFRAFQMHYLLQTTIEKHFKKEIKELSDEMEGIVEKINNKKITFEDAIMEYSDDPDKERSNGLIEGYSTGAAFYVLDQQLLNLKEGEISEPFISPIGCMIIRKEKENLDLNGGFVSADIRQLILSLDRFLPEGENTLTKLQELAMESDVELIDISLLKEIPELQMIKTPPEEYETRRAEIDSLEMPETDWRDVDPDTVIAKLNDYDITSGELKEIVQASMPSKRDMYKNAIYNQFVPSLSMIGMFKDHHEEMISKLKDITAKIEKGEMTFEEAQEEYSTDPGKEQGYVYEGIGRHQFVPEFEKIMFTIPVKEISEPFFTQFGCHILMVEEETKNEDGERETVDVRHILLGFDQYMDKDDPEAMRKLNQKEDKELDIKVYDSYIQSLLPGLGHENDTVEEPEKPVETEEETEELKESEETEDASDSEESGE